MSVVVEILNETAQWIVATELDSDGTIKSGKGYDVRTHLIDVGTITKRTALVMNNHYGTFENAS